VTIRVAGDGEITRPDDGVEGQLACLMDCYETRLFRYAYALTGNYDLAQDCTQDAFLRAYANLRKRRPVTATWLYTVVRNLAMDEFRRRRKVSAGDEDLERVPVEGIGEGTALRAAFADLSPDDRSVLYLLAVEGYSPEEIASLLGTTYGAVRMRISRARQRLRLAYEASS